jgi:hypothetical protein
VLDAICVVMYNNENFPITSESKRIYRETEGGQKLMCEIMERIVMDERIQGKQEDIIELLEDCGSVSDALEKAITYQTDIPTLKKWIKIAAKVSTIEEFESEIGLAPTR